MGMLVFFKCLGCGRKVDGFVPVDPRRLKCSGCGQRNPVISQAPEGPGQEVPIAGKGPTSYQTYSSKFQRNGSTSSRIGEGPRSGNRLPAGVDGLDVARRVMGGT